MGTVILPAMSNSPYESVSHFESNMGDKVDLLWYATTGSGPFQGKVDEVAIYPPPCPPMK